MFNMHNREDRSYHIDYVFLPKQMLDTNCELTVGSYEGWINGSDHMPALSVANQQSVFTVPNCWLVMNRGAGHRTNSNVLFDQATHLRP